jgi:hypothetical protein
MSRYYIQPNYREKDGVIIRNKRLDRYYDERGIIVFNPDHSKVPGYNYEPVKAHVRQAIFRDYGIIVPKDYAFCLFRPPQGGKRIAIRVKLCGYDHPASGSVQTSVGADGSDGRYIEPDFDDLYKKAQVKNAEQWRVIQRYNIY